MPILVEPAHGRQEYRQVPTAGWPHVAFLEDLQAFSIGQQILLRQLDIDSAVVWDLEAAGDLDLNDFATKTTVQDSCGT